MEDEATESFLSSIITEENYPQLTLENIRILEDVIIFSDKEFLSNQALSIINYIKTNIKNVIKHDNYDENIASKLFLLLRFFRVSSITSVLSSEIQDFSFWILTNVAPNKLSKQAFIFLVETDSEVNDLLPELKNNLLKWVYDSFCNFNLENIDMYLFMLPYIHLLVRGDVNLSSFHLPNFIGKFFDIVDINVQHFGGGGVQNDNIRLVSKLLSCIHKLITPIFSGSPPDDNEHGFKIDIKFLERVYALETFIPKSEYYFQVYLNYLVIICCCFFLRPFEKKLLYLVKANFLDRCHLFCFPPFDKNRKIQLCMRYTIEWISKSDFQDLLRIVSPFLSTSSVDKSFIAIASRCIAKSLSLQKGIAPYCVSQLNSCLNSLFYDAIIFTYNKRNNKFHTENWLIALAECLQLYKIALIDKFSDFVDERSRTGIDPVYVSNINFLTAHIVYFLDLMGQVCYSGLQHNKRVILSEHFTEKNFRAKAMDVIRIFVTIIGKLRDDYKKVFLAKNLASLLPTKPHQIFHKVFHNYLQAAINNIYYYSMFFATLRYGSRFETYFYTNTDKNICDLTRRVISTALTNESFKEALKDPNIGSTIDDYISGFMWKVLGSRKYFLLELLITLHQFLFPEKDVCRCSKFLATIREIPNLMCSILIGLKEDNKLRPLVGLIALLYFPHVFDSEPKEDHWVGLFIYAFESDVYIRESLNCFLKIKEEYHINIDLTKKSLNFQARFVTALVSSFKKISPRGTLQKMPASLLSICLRSAINVCSTVVDPKKTKISIDFDGTRAYADMIYKSVKSSQVEHKDIEKLELVAHKIVEKLGFFESLSCKLFLDIMELLHENKSKILDSFLFHDNLEKTYVFVFLRFYFSLPNENVSMEDCTDFCNYCIYFCSNRLFSLATIRVIDYSLKRIKPSEFFIVLITSLISSGRYHPKDAFEVASKLIKTPIEPIEKFVLDRLTLKLQNIFFNLKYPSQKKLCLKIMKLLEENNGCSFSNFLDYRKSYLQDLKLLTQKGIIDKLFDLVVCKPLNGIANILGIAFQIPEYLETLNFHEIPDEVIPIVKNLIHFDEKVSVYFTCKRLIKLLARCIQVVQFQNINQANEFFDKIVFRIFRDQKYECFSEYFFKKMSPINENMIVPRDINKYYVSNNPKTNFPYLRDVIFILYAIRYFNVIPTVEIIEWVAASIRQIKQMTVPNLRIVHRLFELSYHITKKSKDITIILDAMDDVAFEMRHNINFNFIFFETFLKLYPEYTSKKILNRLEMQWSEEYFFNALEYISSMKAKNLLTVLVARFLANPSFIDKLFANCADVLKEYYISKASEFFLVMTDGIGYEKVIMCTELVMPYLKFNICNMSLFIKTLIPLYQINKLTERDYEIFSNRVVPLLYKYSNLFFSPALIRHIERFLQQVPAGYRSNIAISFLIKPSNSLQNAMYLSISCVIASVLGINLVYPFNSHISKWDFVLDMICSYSKSLILSHQSFSVQSPFHPSSRLSLSLSFSRGASFLTATSLKKLLESSKIYLPFSSFVYDPVIFTDSVCDFLEVTPLYGKSAFIIMFFILTHSEKIDFSNLRFIKYILTIARNIVCRKKTKLEVALAMDLPLFLEKIPPGDKRVATILYEILSRSLKMLIRSRKPDTDPKEVLNLIKRYPEILGKLINIIGRVTYDEFTYMTLRDYFSKGPFKNCDHIVFQFYAYVPKPLLYKDMKVNHILESDLILQSRINENVNQCFILAIRHINEYCDSFSTKLIEITYRYLLQNRQRVSKPIVSPCTTLAIWLMEISEDKPFYKNILNIFGGILPSKLSLFKRVVNNLGYPLDHNAIFMLKHHARTTFSKRILCMPFLLPYFSVCDSTKNDLVSILWNIPFKEIHPYSHVILFLRILLPSYIPVSIDNIAYSDICEYVSILISELEERNPTFLRWARYYVKLFPNSSLSGCLWSSRMLCHSLPLTGASLYKNMRFLELRSFYDDSLGLLKCNFPEFSSAASFHQLNNYESAKSLYLQSVKSNMNLYSTGISCLRNVATNLYVATELKAFDPIFSVKYIDRKPSINLPFFLNFTSMRDSPAIMFSPDFHQSSQSTFFSQSYVPFLCSIALMSEITRSLPILRAKQNTNIVDAMRSFTDLLLPANDKLTALVSLLMWRIGFNNSIFSRSDMGRKMQDDNTFNTIMMRYNSIIYKLLYKSNSIKKATKYLRLKHMINPKFKIYEWTLPRVHRCMRDPSLLHHHKHLSYQYLACVRDFRSMDMNHQLFKDNWRKIILELYVLSDKIDSERIFQGLYALISSDFYIAFAFALFKKYPQAGESFKQHLLKVDKSRAQIYFLWLKWLYQIILYVGVPSKEFILTLFNQHILHFFMTLRSLKLYNGSLNSKIEEILNIIKNSQKESFIYRENAEFFNNIIKDHKQDISNLDLTSIAHRNLFEYYETGRLNFYPYVTQHLNINTMDKLISYCEANPPILRSASKVSRNFSATGYRFTSLTDSVINSSIVTFPNKEAVLRFTSVNGEFSYFTIVSSLFYRFNQFEQMITSLVSRFIEKHPSNVTRSRFVPNVYSFSLSGFLTVIHASNIDSLHHIIKRTNVAGYLSKINATSPASSPLEIKNKRFFKDDDIFSVHKWLIDGTEGNMMDFLTFRQCFASSLSYNCAMRFLTKSRLPSIPAVCMFGDRMRVILPGIFSKAKSTPILPLTDHLLRVLPPYILKGCFTTTWLSVFDSLNKHKLKLKIILDALNDNSEENIIMLRRLNQLSPQESYYTDKNGDEFAFLLIEKLIDNAPNNYSLYAPTAWF